MSPRRERRTPTCPRAACFSAILSPGVSEPPGLLDLCEFAPTRRQRDEAEAG